MEVVMKTLKENELELASGGISLFAPASLLMTETWGPVGLAFTAGYAVGTYLYEHRDAIYSGFGRLGLAMQYY
jgi:hypothetical protein